MSVSPGPPRAPGLTHAATETFAWCVVAILRPVAAIRERHNTGRRRRPAGTKETP